jgi:plasmid stability protein
VRTTVEFPDELLRQAKVRAALHGRSLEDMVAASLKLLLQTEGEQAVTERADTAVKSGSAGAWARRFMGVARLTRAETIDDARMDHYRKKYGV